MRAVVFHGPGDLRVTTLADPVLPPGGVIVRVAAVGICGSDLRTWRYGSPRISGPQILGHEFAGTVVASDTDEVTVGTHVAVCPGAPCLACRACRAGHANLCTQRRVLGYDIPGGMADAVAIPSDWIRTGGVVTLDPRIPVAHGAVVEPLHTVLNGQDQARIGPGESVLVLGLGPIGVLHVASAVSRGASVVVGVDPDVDRVARAATLLGEDHVAPMVAGWEERVRAPLRGGGFDVVVAAVGRPEAIATAIEMTEPGGRILAFAGLPANAASIPIDMNVLHYRQLSLVGAFGGTPGHFRRAAEWLSRPGFDVERYTPDRFALDDVSAAFESVAAGHGLKTLLVID